MHKLSFDETMTRFDLIISNMNDANKKNNIMFRRICKEVFQKSYSELEFQNNLNVGAKMAGAGIASVIKMARGRYKKGSFVNAIQKMNYQNNFPTYSEITKINHIFENCKFSVMLKLLKIQSDYGLIRAIYYSQKISAEKKNIMKFSIKEARRNYQ